MYDSANTLKVGNFLHSDGQFLEARSHIMFVMVFLIVGGLVSCSDLFAHQ